MIQIDLPDGPASPLVRGLAACLSSVTEVPLVELPTLDDVPVAHALGAWKSWLAGRGSGLVPIADARSFEWAGWWIGVVDGSESNGLFAHRVDQDEYVGDVVDHIHRKIDEAVVVVADLTESRPNVMYEFGYAKGKSIPVVPISSSPLGQLHSMLLTTTLFRTRWDRSTRWPPGSQPGYEQSSSSGPAMKRTNLFTASPSSRG